MPVKAYYVARSIDVAKLYVARPDDTNENAVYAGTRHHNSVLLSFDKEESSKDSELMGLRGHAVVFAYGSVVFFHVNDDAQKRCLRSFAPICTEPIPEGFQPTEDYCVKIRPPAGSPAVDDALEWPKHKTELISVTGKESLRRKMAALSLNQGLLDRSASPAGGPSEVRFDAVTVPRLDVHNLSVIATVVAQSVALDYYSVKVDAMLATFSKLNASVEQTGVFTDLERQSLFRLVAQNNTMFTDVIAKIGLLERSDPAWKFLEYMKIWDGLRDEFEVEERFKKIEFKLNLIQYNTKFFLEMLHGQKSNTLEWIIIILISMEIIIGCADICNIRPFG